MSLSGSHWQRCGATVYALNDEDTNHFVFSVQPGYHRTNGRTPELELDKIAALAQSAPALQAQVDTFRHLLFEWAEAWHDAPRNETLGLRRATEKALSTNHD